MATAEVLPIEITAKDGSRPAWDSVRQQASETKRALQDLKSALTGLSQGSAESIAQLRNPYVLLAAAIVGVGVVSVTSSRQLAEMGKEASLIGVRASAIDGLGDALKRAGGNADDALSGLKNLRTQLDLNQRDGGYLEKLFGLNGKSLLDATGGLRSIEQVYGDLAQMILNARNRTEALEIATNAFGGQSAPAMVKAIEGGATSLEKLAKTDLDPLIKQSQDVARVWENLFSGKDSDSWFDRMKRRAADLGNELMIAGAAILGSKEALNMQEARRNRDGWAAANETYDNVDPAALKAGFGGTPKPRQTVTPSNRQVDTARTDYDRALNSIGKHISLMEADARAVGATAGEHEKLRVEAQLLDAAQRAGIEITGQRMEQFRALGERAKAAADQLAVLKLQNDLLFERAQMGRSEAEQNVFARLRAAGVEYNSEQGQMLASQIRFNDALKETSDISKDALKSFISDLRAGKSAGEAFANVLDRIAEKLANKAIDSAVNSATGGLSGLFSGVFGGGAAASSGGTGLSLTTTGGFYHSGGIVGAEPTALRYMHAAHFDSAPRFHAGLAPNEFPAILQDGEGVFTKGQMAAMGAGDTYRVSISNSYTNVDPSMKAYIEAQNRALEKRIMAQLPAAVAKVRADRPTAIN